MPNTTQRESASSVSYSENSHPTEEKEESQKGQEDRTLVGSSVSKSFNDVTAFTSEGRVVTKEYDIPREDLTLFSSVHPSEENDHSIEQFLSRAIKIDTIQFKASQQSGEIISKYDVITQLKSNSVYDVVRSKMKNFYGTRFTAKLRITLNPQPFEAGMFQIFFVPLARTMPPLVNVDDSTIVNECKLPFSTSCPNVLCNISTQSEVELAIPYTGPAPFINLTNFYADFGNFYVQCISPIVDSTNNASCDMSVYMSFHDVVLFGTAAYFLPDAPAAMPHFQMLQPPPNEAKMKQGPITSIASNLIPLLNSLGLSAPVADENPSRVSIAPFASPATADTVKNAFKISYLDAHKINIAPIGIDNVDEMDLSHLVQKPTYLTQFTWKSSDAENSPLRSLTVEPNCYTFQATDVTNKFVVSAPNRLRYLSQTFRYWRGTMRFYFHVVATKFHSGRLRFNYVLGGFTQTKYEDYYPKVFTHVIDLRDSTNFVLECPYFGTAPWRNIFNDFKKNTFVPNEQQKSSPFYDTPGYLTIHVENQLKSSTSVSQSVKVIVFNCGGPDFELAVPCTSLSQPTSVYIAPAQVAAMVSNPTRVVTDFLQIVTNEPESKTVSRTALEGPPPNFNYTKLAEDIFKRTRLPLSSQHLIYYATHKPSSATDLGPFTVTSSPAMAENVLSMAAFLQPYYDNYLREKMKSSTGETPQALDMAPISMVSPNQRFTMGADPTFATVGEKISSIRQLIKRYQLVGAGERNITTDDKRPVFVFAPFFQIKPTSDETITFDMFSYFYPLFRFYRGSMRYMITSNNPTIQWNVKYDPTYQFEPEFKTTSQFGARVGIKEINKFPTGFSFNSAPMVGFIPYNINLQGSLEIEFPYYNRYSKVFTQYWTSNDQLQNYNESTFKGYTPLGFVLFELNDFEKGGDATIFKMLRAAADDFNFGYFLGPPLCRVNPSPTL